MRQMGLKGLLSQVGCLDPVKVLLDQRFKGDVGADPRPARRGAARPSSAAAPATG